MEVTKMNKLYENKAAMIFFSLLLALFLFIFVKAERYNNNPVSFFTNISETKSETISDVPVYVSGDVDDYYITGLPETVSVEISGPSNIIDQTLQAREFKVVTENLEELGEGSHYVQLTMTNISKDLNYRISPSSVEINIAQLQSQKYPVEIHVNPTNLAPGYEIHATKATPAEVTLTGSAESLSKISSVSVDVSLPNNTNSDYHGSGRVIVKDREGNILNITANPSQVGVDIAIGKQGSSVPIQIDLDNPNDDYTYDLSNWSTRQVTLFGDEKALAAIQAVVGHIDVSGITQSQRVQVALERPDNVEAMEPESITLTVTARPKNSGQRSEASSDSSSQARQETGKDESQPATNRQRESSSQAEAKSSSP
ncbi:hypothetical protein F6I37_01450 [Aerococcus mictus]|nr:hypothetical protein F6I37_01450 [Aerococcus mictus]RAV96025.1 hypothetical protein DBT53_03295 [Aerococcus mictus]